MTIPAPARTAQELLSDHKGILAADESPKTITKRLSAVGVDPTPEARRAWRELLLTTRGLSESISGVILHEETLHDHTSLGRPFPEVLQRHGLLTGIKVDQGAHPLAGFPDEQVTEGLDGLRERLAHYRELGACFAKWRAVLAIDEQRPTPGCIEANVHALARYASLCQEAGLTPIVEPDVLITGAHAIGRCHEATAAVLTALFSALREQRVDSEGVLLKVNMITPGKEHPEQAAPEQVAAHTMACLRETVPAALPGIVFLSGGQSPEQATMNLAAINDLAAAGAPWQLSFSFARALQQPALSAWAGEEQHVKAAQQALLERAHANSKARAATPQRYAA